VTTRIPQRSLEVGKVVAFAVALAILGDVAVQMLRGPAPLHLLGLVFPVRRMQAEVALAALCICAAKVMGERTFAVLQRPLLAGLLLVAFLCANTRLVGSADTSGTATLPFAVLRDGSLLLDGYACAETNPYYRLQRAAHTVSRYPVATALLALPVYLPAALGHRFDPCSESRNDLEKIAAALLTAAGLALVLAALLRLVPSRAALIACALYALGTAVLPILGQALWQHTGAVLALSAGLWALAVPRVPATRGAILGLAAGCAVACRPVDVVLAAALFAALAREDPRALPAALLGALFPAALLFGYQLHFFGSPFATGYGDEASQGWTANLLVGLPGLLISPGRGLFAVSPVLLLALPALFRPPRGAPLERGLPILGAGCAVYALLLGKWWAWHGAFSAGPRMLSDVLPLLAPGLALFVERAIEARSRLRLGLLGALGALSILSAALLAYVPPKPRTKDLVWELTETPWSWRSWPPAAYAVEGRANGPSR
jgi:hypothetical protein